MKSFICILGILLATICAIEGEKFEQIMSEEDKKMIEECNNEIKDSKSKCFHACLMKKSGEIVNGKIIPEKMLENFIKVEPKAGNVLKEKFDECVATANEQTDDCEVAGTVIKCITEKVLQKPSN